MVVTTELLTRFAEHRPATLHMQRHTLSIKPELAQVLPGVILNHSDQLDKRWVAVQLPDVIEIARPCAGWIGVAVDLTAQCVEHLKLDGEIERIGAQLHSAESHRKQWLKQQRCWLSPDTQSAQPIAEAPPTTSRISWVIAA